MGERNHTQFTGFILLGFSDIEDVRILLFIFFLSMLLMSLIGNMLIIVAVQHHSGFHTPMYFFITVLSFLELWYVMITGPKLLSLLLTKDNRISCEWCFAQLYMFHSLGITEGTLLAIMALDRFMAICNPLRYISIMNERMCSFLAILCWTVGFLLATIPTTLTIKVPLCGPYQIDHYFCDLSPLLALACKDISVTVMINRCVIGFAIMFNFTFILVMYLNIIVSILKLGSNTGKKKAFSTCSSHLTVVVMIYSTTFAVYGSPKGAEYVNYDKLFSLVYTVLAPLLNPIIFSLRNNDIKMALKGIVQRKWANIRLP
ncbi:hypothetical protein XELAEV_18040307mg [Xenopus laevis]|uniref:Olfactory receptor n=1 Tax=Xenopus laevis TaxID=8355 RepID=A0A974C9D8_XENLA|nr:hypothetical protein XELAEV_18040307mg [Xenopus laevis]